MVTTTLLQFDILDLRELVRQLLALPDGACFIGEQSGSVDGQAFVFLKEVSDGDFGPPKVVQTDDDFEIVTQSKVVDIDVEAVGHKASTLMRKLRVLLGSSPAKTFCHIHHFSIASISRPINVGGLMGAGYEPRYRFTLEVSYVHKVKIEQAYIREVDISVFNDKTKTDVRSIKVTTE